MRHFRRAAASLDAAAAPAPHFAATCHAMPPLFSAAPLSLLLIDIHTTLMRRHMPPMLMPLMLYFRHAHAIDVVCRYCHAAAATIEADYIFIFRLLPVFTLATLIVVSLFRCRAALMPFAIRHTHTAPRHMLIQQEAIPRRRSTGCQRAKA